MRQKKKVNSYDWCGTAEAPNMNLAVFNSMQHESQIRTFRRNLLPLHSG